MKKQFVIAVTLTVVIAVTVMAAMNPTGVAEWLLQRAASKVRIDTVGEIRIEPRTGKSVSYTVGTKSMRFDLTGITNAATRTVTFPDANTKLPVFAQLLTFAGPTAARTVTLPDASTTLCGTNAVCTGYQAALTNPLVGAGSGYKLARGVAAITGSGTVATGLTTVVSVTVTPQDDLDGTNLAGVSATVGNQSGAPVAGSVIIKAWKITAADNGVLIAATGAKNVNWIAIGN